MSMGEQEIRALLAIGDMGAYWQRMAKQMEGERNSAYAQLAERAARIARLEAALGRVTRAIEHGVEGKRTDLREALVDAHTILATAPAAAAGEGDRCRCGRPLLSPGDADPWCEGCNMSASTCDCVAVAP